MHDTPSSRASTAAVAAGVPVAPRDKRLALLLLLLTALLGLAGFGGARAASDLIASARESSEARAAYQAAHIRQTAYAIALAEIEPRTVTAPAGQRDELMGRAAAYRATIARIGDSYDPHAPEDRLRGDGKAQLLARANAFAAKRSEAEARMRNFGYAQVALLLALALGAVALVGFGRILLVTAAAMGALGALLALNGFALIVPLPS